MVEHGILEEKKGRSVSAEHVMAAKSTTYHNDALDGV